MLQRRISHADFPQEILRDLHERRADQHRILGQDRLARVHAFERIGGIQRVVVIDVVRLLPDAQVQGIVHQKQRLARPLRRRLRRSVKAALFAYRGEMAVDIGDEPRGRRRDRLEARPQLGKLLVGRPRGDITEAVAARVNAVVRGHGVGDRLRLHLLCAVIFVRHLRQNLGVICAHRDAVVLQREPVRDVDEALLRHGERHIGDDAAREIGQHLRLQHRGDIRGLRP